MTRTDFDGFGIGEHEGIITDTCACPCHIGNAVPSPISREYRARLTAALRANADFMQRVKPLPCEEGCHPNFDGVIFTKDRAVCVAGETYMLYDRREP